MAKKNKQQKKMQRGCPGPGGMGYGYPPPDAAAPPYGGGPEYGMGPGYGAGIPPQGGYGGYGGYGGGPHPHAHHHGYGYGYGYDPAGAAFHHSLKHQGYGYGYGGGAPGGFPGAGLFDDGLLQGMPAFLRSGNAEQFLLGAVLGASAAWVLADEELRGKLIKAGMKLYAGIAGGFEEMKEQMADIKAEVATERHGDT
ncbi:YtxH domain-containing protein [Azotobacter chroococcum]|uniref:YtxH domain-containing protein n=1 Tax=Azotobacter chroococcum TaxID=353 RepID=UPI001E501314|nr:YtxH domain-containing protein [Azotobacter chroococcum]